MEGVVHLTGKNYKLNLIALIGSFVLFIGILGIFVSLANIYQDWGAISYLDTCYEKSEGSTGVYECKDVLFKETGIVLGDTSAFPNASQTIEVVLKPIMWLMLWIAVSLFGIFLFNLGHRFALVKLDRGSTIDKKRK